MNYPRFSIDPSLQSELQLDGYSLAPYPHGTTCQDTRLRIALKLQGLLVNGQIKLDDLDEHSQAEVLKLTEKMEQAA